MEAGTSKDDNEMAIGEKIPSFFFSTSEEEEAAQEIIEVLNQERMERMEEKIEYLEKTVHKRIDNLEDKLRETLKIVDRVLEDRFPKERAEFTTTIMRLTELEDRLATLEIFFHGAPTQEVEAEALTEALTEAALDGREEEVRSLLASGAPVNAENYGRNALYFAAAAGSAAVVQLLIQNGADINFMDFDGESALHIAAGNGNVDCVKLLIRAGALLDGSDNRGRTALHLAAVKGQEESVRALLAAGAGIDCKDNIGRTPEDVASNEDVRNLFHEFRKGINNKKHVNNVSDDASETVSSQSKNHTSLPRLL